MQYQLGLVSKVQTELVAVAPEVHTQAAHTGLQAEVAVE
jgi:hypothetical protein